MKSLFGILCGLGLLLLPLVVYQPSLQGGYIWDDDAHVSTNKVIQDPAGLSRIWLEPGAVPQYYPMTHSSFWLQYQLWGDHPMGNRIVNALMHGASSLLVWLILLRLGVPGALLAAAVFAVHPVQVESVAWISELKNVQSGVFYLLALWVYLLFCGPLDKPASDKPRWPLYALAMFLFILALLSKTVTATLPAVILILLWWKRPRLTSKDITPLIPLFILGIGLGIVTVQFEKHFVGAQGTDFHFSPIDRLLIAGRALWFYASKVFWPAELIFFYPRWVIDASRPLQYIFPAAALGVMGMLFALRHRLGLGPLIAVLFFAGTLAPALGFFDVYPFVYSFVADHFQYLGMLGMVALGVGVGATLVGRLPQRIAQPTGVVLGVVLVAILSTLTWRYCQVFTGLEPLYKDVIAKNPRAWMAQNNLGTYYIKNDRWDEAEAMIALSLSVKPDNDRAHNNMAIIQRYLGRNEEAIRHYVRSINLNQNAPDTHLALGHVLVMENRYKEALAYFQNALVLQPDNIEALVSLAHTHLRMGDAQAAVRLLRELTRDEARMTAEAWSVMGQAYVALERTQEALRAYRQSLALNVDQPEVHNNLAGLLIQTNRTRDAIDHYKAALQDNPSFTTARRNLARALMHQGKVGEAATHYRQVLLAEPKDMEALLAVADADLAGNELQLAQAGYQQVLVIDPLNVHAHTRMGVLHMNQGQEVEALRAFRRALQVDPKFVDGWYSLGLLLIRTQQLPEAAKALNQALLLDDKNGPVLFQLGWLDELARRDAQAMQRYRQAIEFLPRVPEPRERLAWLLATSHDASLRDPVEAVSLATEANKLAGSRLPGPLDALAAAHAAGGNFPEAVNIAKRAQRIAKTAELETLREAIASRLKLYQAGQAYVSPAP